MKKRTALLLAVIFTAVSLLTSCGGKINSDKNESLPSAAKTTQRAENTNLLKVHFIDVGQGDCTFAELPNGETLLIDAGPDEMTAAEYIKKLGCSEVTYIVATHPDADHIKGMAEVLNNFSVKRFYMPEKEHTTKTFEKMLDALEANGCEAIYAEAGKNILNADGIYVKFEGPVKKYPDNNSMSAVVKLGYKNNTFLFTGDADYSAETDMLNTGSDIKADVLKVAHHGSASSTSEKFLKAAEPEYAVISVGEDNKYNHPSKKALSLLKKYNVEVYRTDKNGTITIEGDGSKYIIKTEREM